MDARNTSLPAEREPAPETDTAPADALTVELAHWLAEVAVAANSRPSPDEDARSSH